MDAGCLKLRLESPKLSRKENSFLAATTLELDAEPGFYYYGIASVSTKKENGVISTFEINIKADPFKCQNYQAVTVSQATSTKMVVQGDFETPCIIELTPHK